MESDAGKRDGENETISLSRHFFVRVLQYAMTCASLYNKERKISVKKEADKNTYNDGNMAIWQKDRHIEGKRTV